MVYNATCLWNTLVSDSMKKHFSKCSSLLTTVLKAVHSK
ncbi:rCG53318 [Rattus norvegicus]|uniref:RCG53318 n=1 Tax=Rattus norvegicus TaxID=10116 RepID=A6JMX2_RAT|nr:rCG53318 [Rattus norvegicus]